MSVPSVARPPFIVFEGIEGCGKTTQIEILAGRLRAAGRPFLVTREPGGTPLGESLRELLLRWDGDGLDGLVELFLLEASRRAHVRQVIEPALHDGILVISDRYADSSVAYQGGGRGLETDLVGRLNAIATGGLMPDLTVLLDLPAEEGLHRILRRDRAEDRLERETVDFHRRIRQAYLDRAGVVGEPRYRIVDARLPIEKIAERIYAWIEPLLAREP